MEKTLDRWRRDSNARYKWQEFLSTPEFEQGIKVLESQAVPVVIMGESLEQTAKRQSFQAGFHAAIALVQKLPEIHYKKVQEQLPEWDHINTEDNE
jgi:hypothetical protein|tara:strand:- start:3621 stop:3908 length:288 start_codon:yes stop_codon:yes gene_type:complete